MILLIDQNINEPISIYFSVTRGKKRKQASLRYLLLI
jgi:hypothetical protein